MKPRACFVLPVISLFVVCCAFAFAGNNPACLSPSDAVALETYVQMIPELHLAKGVEKSLASKMSNAAMLISKGRFAAASNLLDALAQEALAQAGKRISPELVRGLLDRIQMLRYCEYTFTDLAFPFQNPSDLERLAPFGVPDWSGSEPHNGIDLILKDGVESSPILSPVEGTVSRIEVAENSYSVPLGQLLVHLVIFVNNEWSVALTFEPSAVGEPMKTNQMEAIRVNVGDPVATGSYLGDLLAGGLGYPHIHYMVSRNDQPVCAYNFSSPEAMTDFEGLLAITPDWTAICM